MGGGLNQIKEIGLHKPDLITPKEVGGRELIMGSKRLTG